MKGPTVIPSDQLFPKAAETHGLPSGAANAFQFLCYLWLVGLLAQAYLAGLGVMDDPARWASHRWFGMALSTLALIQFAIAWFSRLDPLLRTLTAGQLALLLVQIATIVARDAGGSQFVAALHAPNALLIFAVAVTIAARASRTT